MEVLVVMEVVVDLDYIMELLYLQEAEEVLVVQMVWVGVLVHKEEMGKQPQL